MNRAQYEDTQKRLEEITDLLRGKTLSEKERNKTEALQMRLLSSLLSIWLPFGWKRRLSMASFFFAGIYGIVEAHYFLLISWLIVPLLSPRGTGEIAFAFSRFMRWLARIRN